MRHKWVKDLKYKPKDKYDAKEKHVCKICGCKRDLNYYWNKNFSMNISYYTYYRGCRSFGENRPECFNPNEGITQDEIMDL